MKILKGFALSILGLLLFFSLGAFGFVFMLHYTVLNPDFAVAEVNKLDIVGITRDLVKQQLGTQLSQLPSWVSGYIDDTIIAETPWIKQQVNAGIKSGYDYILGKSSDLSISIDLNRLKTDLKNNIWAGISKSPPPELASIPPAMLQQYFNQYFDQFAAQVPSTYTFNLQSLPVDVRAQIEQSRQSVGYIETSYYVLISFMLLLLAGMVLIHHQVRGASRSLGSIFLSYGIVEYAGVLILKNYGLSQLTGLPVPVQLQTWIPQLMADVISPLEIFSLVTAIAGVVLVVVSFVYKPADQSA